VTKTIAALTSVVSITATSTIYTTIFVAENTAPASRGGSSTGLSTGAKAGIGIGVAAGGLLLIAGALLYFIRRKRKRVTGANYPEGTGPNELKAELDHNSVGWRHQASSQGQRAELQ
jgi:hypothetical protein